MFQIQINCNNTNKNEFVIKYYIYPKFVIHIKRKLMFLFFKMMHFAGKINITVFIHESICCYKYTTYLLNRSILESEIHKCTYKYAQTNCYIFKKMQVINFQKISKRSQFFYSFNITK